MASIFKSTLAFIVLSSIATAIVARKSGSITRQKRKVLVGVDFGGTFMKLALIDEAIGSKLNDCVLPIAESKEPQDVAAQIARAVENLLQNAGYRLDDVSALGICCPGRVQNGVVSTVANLTGWNDIPLANLLRERLGLEKVSACNDANAALAGEMWSGAGKDCENVVMITIGTGVGGAVSYDGKILSGSTGMFGEIGHHIICVNGRLSASTGVKGVAEEYCSARALQRTWVDIAGRLSAPNPEEIIRQAEDASNEFAIKAANFTFDHIGILIVNVSRMYDPQRILLGGGLCARKWVVEQCKSAALRHQWTLAPPTYTIVQAVHGNWAGTIGAAWIASKSTS